MNIEEQLHEHLRRAGSGATIETQNKPRAHRIVAASARAQCGELYEVFAAKMPGFREAFPDERSFVKKFWGHFIKSARATLAQSLAGPMREDLKEKVYEALIMDHSLEPARANIAQIDMDL